MLLMYFKAKQNNTSYTYITFLSLCTRIQTEQENVLHLSKDFFSFQMHNLLPSPEINLRI